MALSLSETSKGHLTLGETTFRFELERRVLAIPTTTPRRGGDIFNAWKNGVSMVMGPDRQMDWPREVSGRKRDRIRDSLRELRTVVDFRKVPRSLEAVA